MDDFKFCPICGAKMRNKHDVRTPTGTGFINLTERTCTGPNHSLQIFSSPEDDKIKIFKASLNPKYTKFVQINYLTGKTDIRCFKQGKEHTLTIDKLLEPDFPKLEKLRKKVDLYITFS